jgi:hypothetical protein
MLVTLSEGEFSFSIGDTMGEKEMGLGAACCATF